MFSQQNRADQETVDENSHENCIPCSNSLGNKNWKHSSTTTTSQPFNLFSANALPLHPRKKQKSRRFPDVMRVHKSGILTKNELL